MPSGDRDIRPVSADIGWRVGRLRIRRGLSQNEVARRTGKHTSFISRVERPRARTGVPKRETVVAILDAIEATPEEHAAVFHLEAAPPAEDEIRRQVEAVKAQYEDSDLMVLLLDARWAFRYINARYRSLLGLSDQEYERLRGAHVVLSMIDPTSPLYSRYADEERLRAFSMRAAAFKLRFDEHQFATWFLDLEQRIRGFANAEHVWHTLPVKPEFADLHQITLCHHDGTNLNLNAQLRQMYEAPRFTLLQITPADRETAAAVDRLAPPNTNRNRR